MARSFFPTATNPAWWEHEFGEDADVPTRRRYRAEEFDRPRTQGPRRQRQAQTAAGRRRR